MTIWPTVTAYFAANRLETVGAATAALGIWMTTRRWLICWPITLVSIFIYIVVFYRAGLYSDALLQAFFVVFTLYGWWHWQRGMREQGEVRVEPLSRSSLLVAISLGVPGSFALGMIAKQLGAALPYLDAALMSYSLVASGGRRASTSPTGGYGSSSTRFTLASTSIRICGSRRCFTRRLCRSRCSACAIGGARPPLFRPPLERHS